MKGLEKEREEGLQNICKFQNALYLKKLQPSFLYSGIPCLRFYPKKKKF